MTVSEAAKLLDVMKPGWHNTIDVESLDMNDCNNCILGQIFGHYDNGTKELFPTTWWNESYVSITNPPFGYNTNIQQWLDEIELRQNL